MTDDTQIETRKTEERIETRVFNEFRAKFSQLIEENAEMRLVIAGIGATVAATQERIEERLKEIATALRESVIMEGLINDIREKLKELEHKLENKRESADFIDNRLNLFDENFKYDKAERGKTYFIMKMIGILVVIQILFSIMYHLLFDK